MTLPQALASALWTEHIATVERPARPILATVGYEVS